MKTLLLFFLIVFLYFLFTSFIGFYTSIRPPKIISTLTPSDLQLEYEDVSFVTRDGVTLRGWFIPQSGHDAEEMARRGERTQKTIILLHGYPADKGDILPSFAFLSKTYNLLLFDFRYLGESGGTYSTAGAREKEDLLAAIQFLKLRGIERVGIWGFSVGGAVALMTAPHAPEIQALVSQSSYASLNHMVPELYRVPFLKYPLAYLTRLWAFTILGIDLREVSPARSAKNISIPVFIIHSKNDDVISFQHALLIQEALKENPQAEFWFEENLIHGGFGPVYQKRILEFFQRNL